MSSDIQFKDKELEKLHKVLVLLFDVGVSFHLPDDQNEKTPEQVVRYVADEVNNEDLPAAFTE